MFVVVKALTIHGRAGITLKPKHDIGAGCVEPDQLAFIDVHYFEHIKTARNCKSFDRYKRMCISYGAVLIHLLVLHSLDDRGSAHAGRDAKRGKANAFACAL